MARPEPQAKGVENAATPRTPVGHSHALPDVWDVPPVGEIDFFDNPACGSMGV